MKIKLKDNEFSFLMMNLFGHDPMHDFNNTRIKLTKSKSQKLKNKINDLLNILERNEEEAAAIKIQKKWTSRRNQAAEESAAEESAEGEESAEEQPPTEEPVAETEVSRGGRSWQEKTGLNVMEYKEKEKEEETGYSKKTINKSNFKPSIDEKIKQLDKNIEENSLYILYAIGFLTDNIINKILDKKLDPLTFKYTLIKEAIILNEKLNIAGKRDRKKTAKKKTIRKEKKRKKEKKYKKTKKNMRGGGTDYNNNIRDFLDLEKYPKELEKIPDDRFNELIDKWYTHYNSENNSDMLGKLDILNGLKFPTDAPQSPSQSPSPSPSPSPSTSTSQSKSSSLFKEEQIFANNNIINLFANIGFNQYDKDYEKVKNQNTEPLIDLVIKEKEIFERLIDRKNKDKETTTLSTIDGRTLDNHLYDGLKKNLVNEQSITNETQLKDELKNNSNSRYIINNASNITDIYNKDRVIGCFSSIIDAQTNLMGHEDQEKGNMNIEFSNPTNSKYEIIVNYTNKDNKDIVVINVNSILYNKNKEKFDINIKDLEIPFIPFQNSDENPISVSKVYKKVLDNIFEFLINPDYEVAFTWNKLIENTDFIKSFIESYHPKALGDFLQELNAILKFGGYTFTNPIYKRGTDIEQFGNAKRLFLSGDQVSAVRYIYLKKILEDKYKNLLSRGGYGYKTNSTDIFII